MKECRKRATLTSAIRWSWNGGKKKEKWKGEKNERSTNNLINNLSFGEVSFSRLLFMFYLFCTRIVWGQISSKVDRCSSESHETIAEKKVHRKSTNRQLINYCRAHMKRARGRSRNLWLAAITFSACTYEKLNMDWLIVLKISQFIAIDIASHTYVISATYPTATISTSSRVRYDKKSTN